MNDKISQIMTKAHDKVEELLDKSFESLSFYVCPNGQIHAWVRVNNQTREGIPLFKGLFAGNCTNTHHWQKLDEWNQKASLVADNPDKYFICSECGQVLSKERDFEDNVFAGYYCKDCAKEPEIAKLISDSHKRGFYD